MIGAEAAAQTVPPQAIPPTREEVQRPSPAPVEPGPPRLEVEGGVERAPCALARPEFQQIRFTPTEVVFEDLRGLGEVDLRPAYAPFLGTEQPVAVVCEIRDRAATILRDAGYIAAVEVPEQRIAEGRVRFQVLMAKLVGIRVRGDAGRSERLIASYLEPLSRDEVFNRFTAERRLLLAGDLPGYTVRLALRSAGQARGEVIGEVTVIRTAAAADFNIQNYGSRELGRWGAMLRGQLFGITGLGDRTTVSAFSTLDFEEQQTLQIAHDFRLGGSGLAIGGQYTYAWARPDLGDDAIDIEARTSFATLDVSYPFVRSLSHTLRGAAGLEIVNQDVEFNDLELTQDRLRVAFLRVVLDAMDTDFTDRRYSPAEPRWRFGGTAEIRHGLDIFGASPDCTENLADCVGPGEVPPSRLEGDSTALVLRASAQGEYRPIPKLTFALGARAQHASKPLLSFEEFSAGNYTVGRGYDPGTLLGDSGLGLQAEIRFGSLIPRTARSVGLEAFAFIDQAWVDNEDLIVIAGLAEELTSVGGGIRATYGGQFQLEAMLAAPLDRVGPLAEKPDPRVLISFTTRLWPWSLR